MINRKNLMLLGIALCFLGCANSSESKIPKNLSSVKSFEDFIRSSAGKVNADPGTCDSTCLSRRQEFRYVVYIGKEIYCYWEEKKHDTGTDFDALAASLEQSITTQTSYSQYYRILRQWASAFHDGHVNVLTKSNLTKLEIYTAPVRLEVLAPATDHEKIIISQVTAGVEGMAVGDVVTAVNGVPAADALTKAAVESSSGSTNRMRRFWAGRRLVDVLGNDAAGQGLTFSLTDASGAAKSVTLPRSVEIDSPTAVTPPDTTGAELFSAKVLPGGWGYFRLDGFGGTQDEALISQTMDRLSGTNGLILDLRHNGGGDLSGDRIVERLIDKTVIRYKRSERLNDFILSQRFADNFNLIPDASGLFSTWHDLNVTPLAGHRYSRPVVALISPYCFSACDTFSVSLKGNGLATFIGEPTGGGTGTPLVFDLPLSPLSFRYAVIRGETPSGTFIEGTSTEPDIAIEPTIDDRVKNHDSQLTKAIEYLQGQPLSLPLQGHVAAAVPAKNQGAPSPAVGQVDPTWLQNLDRSPTADEDDTIRKFSVPDNIGG